MARKGVLCSDIYKWLDIVFFSGKEVKRLIVSQHFYGRTFRTGSDAELFLSRT